MRNHAPVLVGSLLLSIMWVGACYLDGDIAMMWRSVASLGAWNFNLCLMAKVLP